MSNVFDNVGVEWPPPSNAEVEKFRRIKIAIASGDLTGEQARTLLLNRTITLKDVEDTISRLASFRMGGLYNYTDILTSQGTSVFGKQVSPNAISDSRKDPKKYGKVLSFPVKIEEKNEIPYKFAFACHRKFYAPVDYGQGADRMTVLPVTPESYSYSVSNQASTFTTVGGGTYSHTIGIDLEKISFEAILPTDPSNKTYVVPYLAKFGYVGAKRMAKNFYYSAQANQPILFSVSPVTSDGTNNGEPLIDPIPMTITSLSAEIRPGHGSDLFISLELQRWHDQEAGIGFIPEYHTVKKGEKIQDIARKYLGNSHKWRELIRLNKKIFRPSYEYAPDNAALTAANRALKPGVRLKLRG